MEPPFNWRGSAIVEVLGWACGKTGFPRTIRVDQGPEVISKDPDLRVYRCAAVPDFPRPGKPTENAFIEPLTGKFRNGKFRVECLNVR